MMPPSRGSLWTRFVAIAGPFFRAETRWRARALVGLIIGFIVCINGLNVLANYTSGDFITAVGKTAAGEGKAGRAVHFALLWGGIFVLLTVVGVIKAFTEDRLKLWWRAWLSRHLYERYLTRRAYFHMKGRTEVDNPDQRISEDVKTFTDQSLALSLILVNSTFTLIAFSGVLWAITPWLLVAAVFYTVFGSFLTIFLGRRLIKLDVRQYKKEADFRYDLIQVRVNAEPVALLGGERDEAGRLGTRLAALVGNMKGVIALSRNISFLTTGYDYIMQLIPLAITAVLVIRGRAEIGALWQAQAAFLTIGNAFSIIVKEFQRISTFSAVVERLGSFYEVMEEETPAVRKAPIEVVEDGRRVGFERLTLVTPRDGRLLLKDFSAEAPRGQRLLILGPSGSGRTTLLRAAAGLWHHGQGRIVRPPLGDVLFLPQQPYLRAGTLRDQLLYATGKDAVPDHVLMAALRKVGFDAVLERVGGLDAEQDWADTLSLGEQQLLACARLLVANPRFAFLDDPASALDRERAYRLYEALSRTAITYVTVAGDPALAEYHDRVVELCPEGAWKAEPVALVASA